MVESSQNTGGGTGHEGPREEYAQRLSKREKRAAILDRRSSVISNVRLVIFLGAVVLVVAGLFTELSFWWLVPVMLVFFFFVYIHDKTIRAHQEAEAAAEFYRAGLRRLDGTWQGTGIIREDLAPPGHPYAKDLDLFGEGSLFDLMCTARTGAGEETLASWLLNGAESQVVGRRQEAVEELRRRLDFREDLSLLGGTTRSLIRPHVLKKWAHEKPVFSPTAGKGLRALSFFLAAAAITGVVLTALTSWGIFVLVGVGLVEGVLTRILKQKVNDIIVGTEGPTRELLAFSKVLARMEREKLSSPRLVDLKGKMATEGRPAWAVIRSLGTLVAWLDQAKNQIFAIIAFFLMWRLQFAISIEKWRATHGKKLDAWLEASGEFDALCAISGYAYENPQDPFPTVVDDGPVCSGEDLGHPLIEDEDCVRNRVHLDAECPLWVVSGSNMSGKSTFLRVVGVNAVLARAGAPVKAGRFTVSNLKVGSTIRVIDSLQEGKSRFYAEISTIKSLVDMAKGEGSLLFLLDEVLHGTNSHDRKIGAQSILSGLLELGAIGLVTTHDLALAKAAEGMGDKARNVHFDDTMENGELSFDYRLKEGVVEKSNALELMRSVGLDIE